MWIATIPVVVSSALVIAHGGSLDTRIALLALAASLLLQALTNLQNDVGYPARRVATRRAASGSPCHC